MMTRGQVVMEDGGGQLIVGEGRQAGRQSGSEGVVSKSQARGSKHARAVVAPDKPQAGNQRTPKRPEEGPDDG